MDAEVLISLRRKLAAYDSRPEFKAKADRTRKQIEAAERMAKHDAEKQSRATEKAAAPAGVKPTPATPASVGVMSSSKAEPQPEKK